MKAQAAANNSSRRITRSAAKTKNRNPLSNLTNLNPSSSTLRKPSISIEKPYDKPRLNSPRSKSSIGSSNFNNNNNAPNPSTVSGNGDGEQSELPVVYSRKPNPEKTGSKGKDVGEPFSLSSQEKAKDNGKALKAVSVALNSPTLEKEKDKGKAIAVPYNRLSLEKVNDKRKGTNATHDFSSLAKTKDKGKTGSVPVNFSTQETWVSLETSGKKTKVQGKSIAGHFNNHNVERTQDEGKATAVSSGSVSLERVKDKGQDVNATPCLTSLAKTKNKGKVVAIPVNIPDPNKRNEKDKGISLAFSCPPLRRTRNFGNELNEAGDVGASKFHTDPHMKDKKKRRCLLRDQDIPEYELPRDFIEQQRAYFKEVDEFELSEEEVSDNEWLKEEGESKLYKK